MTLCTQADVEKRLQWDVTAEPDAVVAGLITAAQALIETEVGRTVESAARTETYDPPARSTLYLAHWPVTAVATVTEDGTGLAADDDYIISQEGDALIRVSGGYDTYWRTTKRQSIVVEYTGGFLSPDHDRQLEHLGSLCTEVVARAFYRGAKTAAAGANDALAVIQSVSLEGSDSVSYATDSGDDLFSLTGGLMQFVVLLEDERNQLFRYRDALVG